MLNLISEPCAGYEHEICGGVEPPYPGPSPDPWDPWWPSPTPPVDPDHDICAELNPCVQGEYIALLYYFITKCQEAYYIGHRCFGVLLHDH